MNLYNSIKKVVGKVTKGSEPGRKWDMSSKTAREAQVSRDYDWAKTERAEQTEKWKELNNYYNSKCYSDQQLAAMAEKYGWNWVPPSLPDAFIQVESQIDDNIPQPQFKGRDDDMDSIKAKEREQVVNFIWYDNHLEKLNLDNERALNELGNAFWKLSFDPSITGPSWDGSIVIGNPDPGEIFSQPGAYEVQESEWIVHAYRWHRRRARRFFGKVIDTIQPDGEHSDTEIYDTVHRTADDDTLQIVEYWYRDDEGDVACSIQVAGVEVKHIPKFWVKTRHSGNRMFPLVKYSKIPVRKSFWDRGEIETVKDLIDAGNREFYTALLNDMFCANDIIVMEDGALVSDAATVPGAHWLTKPGMANSVHRLGGVSANGGLLSTIQFIKDKIEETNGNWASSQGVEPTRVTTASGIAQLNERADRRTGIKKADRTEGFRELAELTDWMALEFYDDDRVILIRGKQEGEPDRSIIFNSDNHRMPKEYGPALDADGMPLLDEYGEPIIEPATYYYPKIDAEVTVGDGIAKSKAFTLAATQELAAMNITPQNVEIVCSIVDLLDLPDKEKIKDSIRAAIQPPAPSGGFNIADLSPEEQQIFNSLPPEEQQAIIQQAGGMPQGQGQPQGPPMPPQAQIPGVM